MPSPEIGTPNLRLQAHYGIMKAGEGMTVVLIISTLGVLLLGYLVMIRLDRFLSGTRETKLPPEKTRVTALVFGGTAELYAQLEREGISYRKTSRPELPDFTAFSTFLALSNDDLDNLTACNRAKHAMPGISVIALCNDSMYMDMYYETAGAGVLRGKPSASDIILVMKGKPPYAS